MGGIWNFKFKLPLVLRRETPGKPKSETPGELFFAQNGGSSVGGYLDWETQRLWDRCSEKDPFWGIDSFAKPRNRNLSEGMSRLRFAKPAWGKTWRDTAGCHFRTSVCVTHHVLTKRRKKQSHHHSTVKPKIPGSPFGATVPNGLTRAVAIWLRVKNRVTPKWQAIW